MTTIRSALLVLLVFLSPVCTPPAPSEHHELTMLALQESGDGVVYHVSLTVSEINPVILEAFASMIPERLDVEVDVSVSLNGTLTIDYDPQAERDGHPAYTLDDARYTTITDTRHHALAWLKATYDIPSDGRALP